MEKILAENTIQEEQGKILGAPESPDKDEQPAYILCQSEEVQFDSVQKDDSAGFATPKTRQEDSLSSGYAI